MNDIDGMQVGLALRDRLAQEHPNLERLVATSLASGTRLHRRRRLAAGGGTAAAIAGVAALTFGLGLVGGGTPHSQANDWADSSPSALPTLQAGQVLDLGNGVTGTVETVGAELTEVDGLLPTSIKPRSGVMPLDGPRQTPELIVVVDGPGPAVKQWVNNSSAQFMRQWPNVGVRAVTATTLPSPRAGLVKKVPVTVPDGWTCEWYLVDDKADCTSADGGVAGLVIRDADERAAWTSDPDKGNDPSVYVTESHRGIFISVQGGRGTTDAEIQQLGKGLTWVD